jgi:hypothetical protein
MTIYDTSLDLLVAQLYVDFLSHAGSAATGVPTAEDLPIEAMDIGKEPNYPSLVVAAKEGNSRGARRVVAVTFMVLTWLRSQEPGTAEVAEQTTRDQASEWIGAVDRRIRQMEDGTIDDEPVLGFRSWLASLSAERLQGWRITKIVPGGMAPVQRNEKMRTIFYGCTMDVHVVSVRESA